jgi:hypothetical protein
LKKTHDINLLQEDDRLEKMNEKTKKWWDEMTKRMGGEDKDSEDVNA